MVFAVNASVNSLTLSKPCYMEASLCSDRAPLYRQKAPIYYRPAVRIEYAEIERCTCQDSGWSRFAEAWPFGLLLAVQR